MYKAKPNQGNKMDGATAQAALEELVKCLLENRGELELGHAVLLLSQRARKFVSDYGALEFVKKFPQLFEISQTRQKKSKVMVKLDVPLQFCPQAGETGGCTKGRCDLLHLCPFFVKESCKFGDKCKRSHNYHDAHTTRVVSDFRLDFLNSSLLQKILKVIVDEGEIQRAAANRSVPDICKFYNKAVCKKGELCPCLHVCEHFVDGDCKFGAKCKREHGFSNEHNIKVLEEYDMGGIGDRRVLQRLKGRERKRTLSASSDAEETTPLRRNLVQSLVSNTRINFPMPPASSIQRAGSTHSLPEICKFYSKATCKKDAQCHCLHVCEHFINGDCKFGEKCKREHDFSNPHNRRILKEHHMGDISELKVLERLQTRERKRTVSTSSDGDRPEQFPSTSANAIGVPSVQANNDTDKDTEICGFNLRGRCNYGNSCIHRHTELPYLWEFAAQGDDRWESFSSDLNMTLERAYCDVRNDISEAVTINGSLYHVRFQDMTAVPLFPQAAPNPKFPRVRRLSTISSVVAAAGHVFSTRWQWYWKDENGKWQSYDTPGDGHAVNTTSSQCFERDYVAGKDSHPFSAGHHHYTLYFKGWCQQNDVHKTRRAVRRRPAEFVSKDNMKDIIVQRRRAAVTAPSTSSASSESDSLPTHWTPIPEGEDYSCVVLQTISDEYKKTEKKFQQTMDGSHEVIRIERVQNPELWTLYAQRKTRMAKKSGKEPEERQLFHGTKPDTAKAICQQGFDWRMYGKHGTTYGKGSYFACKANYSHRYSNHGVFLRGPKQMFLARVAVGSYTRGNSSMTRPPPKDPSNPNVLHDSCSDNTANPALFVIFENGQSYPEFLITYL